MYLFADDEVESVIYSIRVLMKILIRKAILVAVRTVAAIASSIFVAIMTS